eukprot:NODE_5950_length_271_cov_32.355856_g5867_i0.p2 GENE.NODE_5950_length_271_cov_32.355856_g5867_i0~~NODE_5950_length_271_cov_32.355856_g5867_i0.p2  ORF type:complete len:53 (+),score=7.06 NODE_5950_length_271_cov_32.355856_g5867_i0:13-171(+)
MFGHPHGKRFQEIWANVFGCWQVKDLGLQAGSQPAAQNQQKSGPRKNWPHTN